MSALLGGFGECPKTSDGEHVWVPKWTVTPESCTFVPCCRECGKELTMPGWRDLPGFSDGMSATGADGGMVQHEGGKTAEDSQ